MVKAQQPQIAIWLVILAIFALAFPVSLKGQEQKPKTDPDDVVRVETNLVQLQTVVTDRSGRAVDNLAQDDFEVMENGHPQKISFFSLERVGGSSSSRLPDQAILTPESQKRSPRSPSRSIVIFVDTLHLSGVSLLRAKQQLKKFIDDQISDDDLVAVVTSSWGVGVLQQFIRDRRLLKFAIDKIAAFPRPHTLYAPYLAARVSMQDQDALSVATQILASEEGMASRPELVEARARQILEEEGMLRKSTLQALKGVSERLAEMPGQRMIAFFSDGFTMLEDAGSTDTEDLVAATSRAARRGVILYSFTPQGLTTPIEYSAATPINSPDFSRLMSESESDSQDTLRHLSSETGGEAYLNNNDLNGLLKKMLTANQVYYTIAYYPADNTDKRKFRNITVRLRNHPELKIRTQKGYQVMPEKKAGLASTPRERLVEAMMAPLPITGIDVDSSTSFLERGDDDAQATLQVHIAGNSLEYQQTRQTHLFSCEIAVVVLDRTGKISQNFGQALKGELTAAQLELAKHNGYRYEKRLKLGPGMYQVRVGVRDVKGELMGTTTSWVVVPDVRKQKLVLSSIFLGKAAAAEENIKLPEAGKTSSRPTLIIGRGSFKKGEPLFYRFVVYDPTAKDDSANTQIKVEVLSGDAPVYEGPWQPLGSRSIRSDKTGVEAGGELTLGVEPGVYTLRVTVKDVKSNKSTKQTVDFELD